MKKTMILSFAILTLSMLSACGQTSKTEKPASTINFDTATDKKVVKTEDEWKKQLTPEQYHVIREKGTEHPFSGAYWNTFELGEYHCAACDNLLFLSNTKFDGGCGWPSFNAPIYEKNIVKLSDKSLGMERTEVQCAKCGGHLGHVFDDGPPPTHLRYCINSASIKFIKK